MTVPSNFIFEAALVISVAMNYLVQAEEKDGSSSLKTLKV